MQAVVVVVVVVVVPVVAPTAAIWSPRPHTDANQPPARRFDDHAAPVRRCQPMPSVDMLRRPFPSLTQATRRPTSRPAKVVVVVVVVVVAAVAAAVRRRCCAHVHSLPPPRCPVVGDSDHDSVPPQLRLQPRGLTQQQQ